MWQSALIEAISTPMPTPMRPLSLTDDGCRNSHTARTNRMTGSANASRPNRPPNVYASRAMATGSFGLNHSTIAPPKASNRRKNGTPSRSSSFARVSFPNSRAPAPTACASDIQPVVNSPGSCAGTGRFLTAGLRAGVRPRVVDVRAREVDLVLVAMRSTVLPGAVKAL